MKESHAEAERVARCRRAEWGLSGTEPVSLRGLLLELNIETLFRPLSRNIAGLSIITGSDRTPLRFMLVNSTNSIGRQHFTICHELYHLFEQQNFSSSLCAHDLPEGVQQKHERAADAFAAAFLLPEAGVLEMVPQSERRNGAMSIVTMLRIEQRYRCSRKTLLHRLVEIGLLRQQSIHVFEEDVVKIAREHGFDTGLYLPGNEGLTLGRYGSLARRLYETDCISHTHYLALLQDIGIELDFGAE